MGGTRLALLALLALAAAQTEDAASTTPAETTTSPTTTEPPLFARFASTGRLIELVAEGAYACAVAHSQDATDKDAKIHGG